MSNKTKTMRDNIPFVSSDGVVNVYNQYTGALLSTYGLYGSSSDFTNNDQCPGTAATIVYTGGPRTTPLSVSGVIYNVPVFKFCDHTKITRTLNTYSDANFKFTYSGKVYQVTVPGAPRVDDGILGINRLSWTAYALSVDGIINSFSDNAASSIYNLLRNEGKLLGFPDAFNVMNFILELRDIKRLPSLITKWTKSSHDVSDKFLGYQFGLVPFFSDIRSIFTRMTKIGPALSRWNDFASKGKILNGHVDLPLPSSLASNPNYVGYADGYHVFKTYKPKTNVGRTVITSYGDSITRYAETTTYQYVRARGSIYYLPRHISPDRVQSIERELWGINKPLTAIWNFIPYSFVVDWFTNLGDIIQKFEDSAPLLPVKVVSCGFSVEVKTVMVANLYAEDKLITSSVLSHKRYYRQPLSPTSVYKPGASYGALQFSTLTTDQTLLGSALLHQLLR